MSNTSRPLFSEIDFLRALKGHNRNDLGYAVLHAQDKTERLNIWGIRVANYLRDIILEGGIEVEGLRRILEQDKKLKKYASVPIQNDPDNESHLERNLRQYARLGMIQDDCGIGEPWAPISPDYVLRGGPSFSEARVEMKLIPNGEMRGIYDMHWSNGELVWVPGPQRTLVIDTDCSVRAYTARSVARMQAAGQPL